MVFMDKKNLVVWFVCGWWFEIWLCYFFVGSMVLNFVNGFVV